MGVFNFTVLASRGEYDNSYVIHKQLRPTLELAYNPDCPVCRDVVACIRELPCDVRLTEHAGTIVIDADSDGDGEERPASPVPPPYGCYTTCRALGGDGRVMFGVPLPLLHPARRDAPAPTRDTIAKRIARTFTSTAPPALRPHQKDVLNHAEAEGWDYAVRNGSGGDGAAFHLYMTMGSGKTRAAVELVCARRARRALFVCHNTLCEYMYKNIAQVPLQGTAASACAGVRARENTPMEIHVMSFSSVRRLLKDASDFDVVVIDEMHYYKNMTAGMLDDIDTLARARNRLVLCGTPIVNTPADLDGYARLMLGADAHKRIPSLAGLYNTAAKRGGAAETDIDAEAAAMASPGGSRNRAAALRRACACVREHLKGRIAFYDPAVHSPAAFAKHYPAMEIETKRVPMTWAQTADYMLARRATVRLPPVPGVPKFIPVETGYKNAYNSATLMVCLQGQRFAPDDAPLLDAVADDVAASELWPQVVYADLIDAAIDPIAERLAARLPPAHARVAVVTGATPTRAREAARSAFNQGRIDVLMITRACGTGLDLLGAARMLIVTVHKTPMDESQTITRIRRLKSHCKSKHKSVLVTKYLACFPPNLDAPDDAACRAVLAKAVRWQQLPWIEALPKGAVGAAIVRAIREEEKGRTIAERISTLNELKLHEMQPLYAALQECSIPMTRDTSARALDAEEALADGPGAAAVADKGSLECARKPRRKRKAPEKKDGDPGAAKPPPKRARAPAHGNAKKTPKTGPTKKDGAAGGVKKATQATRKRKAPTAAEGGQGGPEKGAKRAKKAPENKPRGAVAQKERPTPKDAKRRAGTKAAAPRAGPGPKKSASPALAAGRSARACAAAIAAASNKGVERAVQGSGGEK